MCFDETVFLYACVSAKLEAARKERERVISEQFSSTLEIGSAPPSCPTQVWSEGAEKRKGDQMRPFKSPSLQHQKRRNDVYKPVAHLPEKVSQCETNIEVVYVVSRVLCVWVGGVSVMGSVLNFLSMLFLQDQRLISAMVQRWSEEERVAAAREEEAWQREVREREEQRETQERQLRHQKELQHARQRFQKQVN